MRESLHCKILLVLLMVVFAPARMLANEMYGNTSSDYATPVGDSPISSTRVTTFQVARR